MTMKRPSANRNLELFCDAVALLMKAPRTQPELAIVMGRKLNTVRRWVKVLRSEGLVYVREWRPPPERGGVFTAAFELQPTPWALQDAPRPRHRPKRQGTA